jgi:hypothetical protein
MVLINVNIKIECIIFILKIYQLMNRDFLFQIIETYLILT